MLTGPQADQHNRNLIGMQAARVAQMRHKFYRAMWLLYMAIVGVSTLVAVTRYAVGDDGSLHHLISMTSNHLVLVCHSLSPSSSHGAERPITLKQRISGRAAMCEIIGADHDKTI